MDLKKFRIQQGFTQKTLADKMEVHYILISKIENCTANLSAKMRRKYMDLFKITPEQVQEMWQETVAENETVGDEEEEEVCIW